MAEEEKGIGILVSNLMILYVIFYVKQYFRDFKDAFEKYYDRLKTDQSGDGFPFNRPKTIPRILRGNSWWSHFNLNGIVWNSCKYYPSNSRFHNGCRCK
jgi:hypothetical protein